MFNRFDRPDAIARIAGNDFAPRLQGEVKFYQKNDGVLVVARVSGLPRENRSGFFGLHIHEGATCKGEDFSAAGSHYNPEQRPHPAHAGDLPPLLSCRGNAYMAVMTDRFRVCDVIGRTVIIHCNPDDFRSQPAGNAGERIACGVICRA